MFDRTRAWFANSKTKAKDAVTYTWNMLTEPSSIATITGGIAVAAALPSPWSYASVGLVVAGVLRKENGKPRLPGPSSEGE